MYIHVGVYISLLLYTWTSAEIFCKGGANPKKGPLLGGKNTHDE